MSIVDQRGQSVGQQYNIAIDLPSKYLEILFATAARENLSVEELKTESWEPVTAFIPAGEFVMGSDEGEGVPRYETPSFTFYLPAFRIGKYPVTNEEFARFVREKEYPVATEMGWLRGRQPASLQNKLPVKGVSWEDAMQYCAWLSEQTDRPYTLPSEAQWEKAARGQFGALFPWEGDWNVGAFCNVDSQRVTPVDAYQKGASPYGCLDMVGNIREWTTTVWGRYRRLDPDKRSVYPWETPWKANEGRDEFEVANPLVRRVTRGGTALIPGTQLRAARRHSELPYRRGLKNSRTGFRIALNLQEE